MAIHPHCPEDFHWAILPDPSSFQDWQDRLDSRIKKGGLEMTKHATFVGVISRNGRHYCLYVGKSGQRLLIPASE